MTDAEAEALRQQLVADLTDIIELLRASGVTHWPVVLDNARCMIENRDFTGVERLLSCFGGMGSFNDLVIDPQNGHTVAAADCPSRNQRLIALTTRLYATAQSLKRYFDAD